MPDAELVLAVDGGNSKTLAALATREGRVLAVARGAGSDIYGRGSVEVALDALDATLRAAFAEAKASAQDVGSAAFSLAGADWPEDFALLEGELTKRLALRRAPLVVNDALGALRLGAPGWEGIAVVCGTFNAVGARHRDGRAFHLGFWPDRVGGFDLGTEALKAAYRDGLGLGPPTQLRARALTLFGADDVLALMHAFTRREGRLSPFEVQRLAPVLLELADAGDPVAGAIVREGGRVLGDQARACAERVGLPLDGATLVLTGGVLQRASGLLVDAIVARVPGTRPVRPPQQPLLGALLLACDALGCATDTDALAASLAQRVPA